MCEAKIVMITKVHKGEGKTLKKKNYSRIYRQILLLSVLFAGILGLFWITADKSRIHVMPYSDVYQEGEGLSVEEDVTLQLEFRSQMDELNGFLFYYNMTEEDYGKTAKLIFTLCEPERKEKVAQKEIPLAVQKSGALLYVSCPVKGIKDRDLVLTIRSEGLEDHKAPSLGLAVREEASYSLKVNDREHAPIYLQLGYPTYQSGFAEALMRTLCVAAAVGLILYMLHTGQIIRGTKETVKEKTHPERKGKKKPEWKVLLKNLLLYGLLLLLLFLCLEFVWAHAVRGSAYEGMKKFYFAVSVVVVLLMSVIFYGVRIGGWNPDKLLLLAVLGWGMVYCVLLPIYTVPDEPSHIDTAYRVSNRMLGIEDSGIDSALYRRYEDIDIDSMQKTKVTRKSYRELWQNLLTKAEDQTLVESYSVNNLGNVPEIFYLPQAVGLSIGRLLGAGRVPTLMLGRMFSLLAAALLMYFGVKKLPFGKSVFYVIALLPITLQEVMSFSYDAFLIGSSFLFAGYLLYWFHAPERLTVREMAVLLAATMLLGLSKAGVYLPLTLLPIATVYMKQNGNIRCRIITAVWMTGSIGLCYLVQYPTILMRTGIVARAASRTTAAVQNYQIKTLIKDPVTLFRILENTFAEKSDIYLRGILGGKLGWLNITIPWHVCLAFTVLLLLAVIPGKDENYIRNTYRKVGIWVTSILSAGLILASMLIAVTPDDSKWIQGVQGRYFLPFLGLALLAIPTGNIRKAKKKAENDILAGSILQIFVIAQIWMQALK